MKKLMLGALVLGGCVADLPVEQQGSGATPGRIAVEGTILAATDVEIISEHRGPREVATVEVSTATLGVNLSTVCKQSELFPISNVCSMMCDPDRLIARIVGDGVSQGGCVQYHCALAGDLSVSLGVCLN